MCGIAGVIDLTGRRPVPDGIVKRMARALIHRGPDEEGFLHRPGLTFASRRLSIVGLADGQQPVSNEDHTISVVFNGELFNYREQRAELLQRGHHLVTHCDTELIPHLWEESREDIFRQLRGQFAIALYDQPRHQITLARDRFGISPLYWTRQGDWLLFASEIKSLLASGHVTAKPDRRGLDQIFTFAAMPGPVTCFEGIHLLPPGHFLQITPSTESSKEPVIREQAFWKLDFPDQGHEPFPNTTDPKQLIDEFEQILLDAVEKRLRADVPVGAYLSGGLDSSLIVAMARHIKGPDISTYTIQVDNPVLDELSGANQTAKHIGIAAPLVQPFSAANVLETYPQLIQAAESPVVDTSCAALLMLARRVHENGQKVVLTGEGADEWLAGYPWYKIAKALHFLDLIPGLPLSNRARRAFFKWNSVPQYPLDFRPQLEASVGGPNAWIDSYGLLSLSKLRFYSESMHEVRHHANPWTGLDLDLDRAKKWHPLNRGLWFGTRVTLSGLLLQAKGDRVAMLSSIETRYPFLDEAVCDFTSQLHPDWKLHGFRDKYLLRLVAERWLPKDICQRKKAIFRAPIDGLLTDHEPKYISQLLSEESLKRTGYFDIPAVQHWRQNFSKLRPGSFPRLSIEMGLTAVIATQLWHHTFIDPTLADLPSWSPAPHSG